MPMSNISGVIRRAAQRSRGGHFNVVPRSLAKAGNPGTFNSTIGIANKVEETRFLSFLQNVLKHFSRTLKMKTEVDNALLLTFGSAA